MRPETIEPDQDRCCRCGFTLMPHRSLKRSVGDDPREYCARCYGQVMARLAGFLGREQRANATYKRLYGITLREYGDLYAAQRGVCAVCHDRGRPAQYGDMMLVVDHDHATGAIRGLLCSPCNRGIGLLGDTEEAVAAALDYLRRNPLS